MAFSGDAASAASNSPPVPMQNPGSSLAAGVLPNQYPMQYANQQKMDPVAQSQQSMPQQPHGMPMFVSARDWQQSVASVFDPEGSKRKWGYPPDLGVEHPSKRAR